jgi:hypothetical protein
VPSASTSARVLILTTQPLVAALIGILLELEHFEPAFAEPDERPEDALTRVRPLMAVVLDGELDAARSDLFFARAARRGVRIVLFCPPGSEQKVRTMAEARSVPWFSLPMDRATVARLLGDGTPVTRGGKDRRGPSIAAAPDGAIVYDDDHGRRWLVYDRRGGDRRAAEPEAYRVFVSESGEEWRVRLDVNVPHELTPASLAEQLARATPMRSERR